MSFLLESQPVASPYPREIGGVYEKIVVLPNGFARAWVTTLFLQYHMPQYWRRGAHHSYAGQM